MQVTHQQDHVTHAVINNKSTIDFGISSSAEFFHILSSTLYKDQILAVVRETLCNAWDAHIEAGIKDKAVEVTLQDGKLTIRDFGNGIAEENMGEIYGTYGNSTKKNDGNQTGGFGLGCKAPFAYTEHFEVISRHKGKQTIYSLARSSAAAMGKPGITPIATFPTDETGLSVTIDIKPNDTNRFTDLIQRIAFNGDMYVVLNGQVQKKLGFDTLKQNYMVIRDRSILDHYHPIMVRYGNVIYPVESSGELDAAYEGIHLHLKSLRGRAWSSNQYSIIFQAPPHSISVTPSRESLSMQEHTTRTLNKIFKDFLAIIEGPFKEACAKHGSRAIRVAVMEKRIGDLLDRRPGLPAIKDLTSHYRILTLEDLAETYMVHNYPEGLDYRKKDVMLRLIEMSKAGLLDQGKVQSYIKELKHVEHAYHMWGNVQKPTHWLQRHVLRPLLTKLAQAELPTSSFFVFDAGDDNWEGNSSSTDRVPPLVRATKAKPKHILACMPYLRNIVVLSARKEYLGQRCFEQSEWTDNNYGDFDGFLFYHMGRKKAEQEAAREFWAKSGMKVIDLTLLEEPEPKVVPSGPKKPRPKGIPLLSEIRVSGQWRPSNLREEDVLRIEDPEFILLQYASRSDSLFSIGDLPSHVAHAVVTEWGHKGGVATTKAIYDKWIKKGTKDVIPYVCEKIHDHIVGNSQIKEFWAFDLTRVTEQYIEPGHAFADEHRAILELMYKNPRLRAAMGIQAPIIDIADKKFLHLFEHMLGSYEHHDEAQQLRDTRDWLNAIPLDPLNQQLVAKITSNPLVAIMSDYQISKMFRQDQSNPEVIAVVDALINLFK